jgi:hemerythrin-like domain-containing protein
LILRNRFREGTRRIRANPKELAMAAAIKNRPIRPAVPALPTMDTLDRTHREALEMLDRIRDLLNHLDDHGADDHAQQRAKEICSFFGEAAREHHAAEEAVVFPPLLRAGDAEIVQQVRRLQQDHGWLEEDWLELAPQLTAVAQGYSGYDLDLLRSGLDIFGELYREHIALEESMIYPAARRRAQIDAEGVAQRAAGH